MSELVFTNLTKERAAQCAALELQAFPHADPAELLNSEDIEAYADIFPEGFFVCLDGDRVVGQGAGIFLDFDFDDIQHRIVDITGEHQCLKHDWDGAWYYGTDIVVHPDYRRRGIGKRLYQLRKDVVREHNKRGIIAGGHMNDYAQHMKSMSVEEYVAAVKARELYDATLTFQLDNGFEIRGVLYDYLRDEATNDASALIVWENPDYRRSN
ncbi:MAG: GNAT family N-acetyltransferase [Acidimicrobiia bacterium]